MATPDQPNLTHTEDACRLLGFDYGTRKIGIATANTLTGTSQALVTLPFTGRMPSWLALDSIFQQWQPDTLVVGQPLHLDGSKSAHSKACQKFAIALHARYQTPVVMSDERLSSDQAELLLRQARSHHRRRAQLRDAVAAELILRTYMQQL